MRHEDDSWLDRATHEAHQAIARIHAEGLAALDEILPRTRPRPGGAHDPSSTGWFEPITDHTPPPY